jgi:NADH-quinone oxidoreductase subunit G
MVPKKVSKEIETESSKLLESIGLDDSFYDELEKLLAKKENFSLIIGEDCMTSSYADEIAELVGLFENATNFKVLMIPAKTNTLGVSLICDLDSSSGNYSVGYNEKGNFVLSSLGIGDLDMPALNQQEGTFTSIDKRVLPTNVAIDYNGYLLLDVAKALNVSLEKKYTIDYTNELPVSKGFKSIQFDDLSMEFGNDISDNRGYLLENNTISLIDNTYRVVSNTDKLNGVIVYRVNPTSQFNHFTNKAHQLATKASLFVTSAFLEANGLAENDVVELSNSNGKIVLTTKIDTKISGSIAYLPTFDSNIDTDIIFGDGYRFTEVNLKKV